MIRSLLMEGKYEGLRKKGREDEVLNNVEVVLGGGA